MADDNKTDDNKNQIQRRESENMPALPDDAFPLKRMPLVLRVWFDDALFNRVKTIAQYLARATGITPPHLLGKEEACFSVVVDSLNWRLSPYMVARSTFQTPEGKIGYEGKLIHAILVQSGALEEEPSYELFGDWSKVIGKFQLEERERGGKKIKFPKATYTIVDQQGLGVIVRAKLRGKGERAMEFLLTQAYPRFSTLWATDPATQIKYAAIRRFASLEMPHLIFGIPFDRESMIADVVPAGAIDITPSAEPTRSGMVAQSRASAVDEQDPYDPGPGEVSEEDQVDQREHAEAEKEATTFELYDEVGEMVGVFPATDFLRVFMTRAASLREPALRATMLDNNKATVDKAATAIGGDHPLASQAREFYEKATNKKPPKPPEVPDVPPIDIGASGKPDFVAWQNAVYEVAQQIGVIPLLERFQAKAIEAAVRAKAPTGYLNNMNLRFARFRGDLEKS